MPQLFSVIIGGHNQMVTKDVMLRERKKNGDLLGRESDTKPVVEEKIEKATDSKIETVEPKKKTSKSLFSKKDLKPEKDL